MEGGRTAEEKWEQSFIIAETSAGALLNSFMRSERNKLRGRGCASHFRGNTGSRACAAQGEEGRVGERKRGRGLCRSFSTHCLKAAARGKRDLVRGRRRKRTTSEEERRRAVVCISSRGGG